MPLSYGVEIECIVPTPRDGHYREIGAMRGPQVAAAIEAAGVSCYYAGYTHEVGTRWKIVTDGSLHVPTGYTGLEIVSPPLEEGPAGFEAIGRVCAALREIGATVNRSCGLHVHVGVRHLPIAALRRLAVIYADHEEVIDALLPPSRRGTANSYSQPVKGVDLARLLQARNAGEIAAATRPGVVGGVLKYTKLNFSCFWKYGTVEFRHHSGTVDAAKITKWVTLCMTMVKASERTANEPIAAPVVQNTNGVRTSLQRTVFSLISRPEGVTNQEAQIALGWRHAPTLPIDLNRMGVAFVVDGRRGRARVYKLAQQAAVLPRPPATLENMLAMFDLPEEDRTFWLNRRNALAGSTSMRATSFTSVENLP